MCTYKQTYKRIVDVPVCGIDMKREGVVHQFSVCWCRKVVVAVAVVAVVLAVAALLVVNLEQLAGKRVVGDCSSQRD